MGKSGGTRLALGCCVAPQIQWHQLECQLWHLKAAKDAHTRMHFALARMTGSPATALRLALQHVCRAPPRMMRGLRDTRSCNAWCAAVAAGMVAETLGDEESP